jgi:general stress protein 26
MDASTRRLIDELISSHNTMTLATVRPDGFPQATTVGYVNEGLTLYVGVGSDSQKLHNIMLCNKVSLTIDHEDSDWGKIQGLSMGATAAVVSDPTEIERIGALMVRKFPQLEQMPPPDLDSFVFLRITPRVISVLDYTKGFGHTELVDV